HQTGGFAELVCSNSLKASRVESASGLLKEEMRRLGSVLLPIADRCAVEAGGALAVDRLRFSRMATETVGGHPLISIIRKEQEIIPDDEYEACVVATGPLTDGAFAGAIDELCGGRLSFYDAAAPIVTAESLDMGEAFFASRYGRGGEEGYVNCPMDKEQYEAFYHELISAERAVSHIDSDSDANGGPRVYEACMPVEIMARRGLDTIRFGPLKPVGLRDPRTGRRPWANLQLRREDAAGRMYNLVGFQTNLKFGEQKRVFSMIPALKNAEFVRYGVMHRNSFINSPGLLNGDFSLRGRPGLFFAGQITGVEGYMESAGSGILAGINAARFILGEEPLILPGETMLGALTRHVSDESASDSRRDFQPMGANFGILPPIEPHIRDKKERCKALAERSLRRIAALE
ncbi:MAG: methylenetetrahydrofolate--tRNA-(uracil(54)-C(5))-methyltransferase (FADH(2)-oxidizing) TrmFO, partial [Oscillospiraceae bacterium]|nr:methylenetetrahydrofolate--tRNA-(uracil(54)-C(5))-methyltransferase (FADH(2)-oxidizing) TrmFO [Oscillospiraceae bacterium]